VKKDNEKQAVLWWPLVIEKVQTIKKKRFLTGRLLPVFVLYILCSALYSETMMRSK